MKSTTETILTEYQTAMKQIEKGRRAAFLGDYHRKCVEKYRNRIRADQESVGKNRKEA